MLLWLLNIHIWKALLNIKFSFCHYDLSQGIEKIDSMQSFNFIKTESHNNKSYLLTFICVYQLLMQHAAFQMVDEVLSSYKRIQ